MRIGIAGPILIDPFKSYLNIPSNFKIPGGLGGTPVVHLVNELLRRGNEIVVFTLDRQVDKELIIEGEKIRFCIGPYRKQGRARDIFKVERNYLSKAMLSERPDFIHAHWTYEFALSALATKIPSLVTAHDAPLQILRYDFSPYRVIRTVMAWMVIRTAKNITTVSPYVAEHLKKIFGYKEKVSVIPNGMPDEMFEASDNKNPIKKPKKKFIFASVLSSWGTLKNGSTLIEAFGLLKRKAPDIELWMYGNGYGESEAAEYWARKKGINAGIRFVGNIPYKSLIEQLSHNIDVLVHPALNEAHPMSVVEAMAIGIPVIGGRSSGGIPYTLGYGKAGVLVDIKSPKEISEAMYLLMEDGNYRKEVSHNSRQYAKANFMLTNVVNQYEQLYRQINHSLKFGKPL